jgi:hypothetical protein
MNMRGVKNVVILWSVVGAGLIAVHEAMIYPAVAIIVCLAFLCIVISAAAYYHGSDDGDEGGRYS